LKESLNGLWCDATIVGDVIVCERSLLR
jgi:hypothetical protein